MKFLYFLFAFSLLFCFSCSKLDVSNQATPSTSGIKFYGDQYGEVLRSFEQTQDGGYMFGGYTSTSNYFGGGREGFIQKSDKSGNVVWYKTYGGAGLVNIFDVVHQTSDGGFIAAGSTSSNGYYSSLAYLVKTDKYGEKIWEKTFLGDTLGAYFFDVKEMPDHGFAAVGFSNANAENPLLVVKTNQSGDSLWTKQYVVKKNYQTLNASLAIGPNGEIAIASMTQPLHQNLRILSIQYPTFTYLSPNGNLLIPHLIDTIFGSMPYYYLRSPVNCEKIISRPDGFIFIFASSPQGPNPNMPTCSNCGISLSITIFKIDFNGNVSWHQTYTGMGSGAVINDAKNNPGGGLLISGSTTDAAGINYCWLLNTDESGRLTHENFIPIKDYTSWSDAAGAINNDNSMTIGVNLIPNFANHEGFFGFFTTDLNGKIIEKTNQ